MTRKPSEMIFISKIKPNGSGTQVVSKREINFLNQNPVMANSAFNLNILCIYEETYIASGHNSYVVKLK